MNVRLSLVLAAFALSVGTLVAVVLVGSGTVDGASSVSSSIVSSAVGGDGGILPPDTPEPTATPVPPTRTPTPPSVTYTPPTRTPGPHLTTSPNSTLIPSGGAISTATCISLGSMSGGGVTVGYGEQARVNLTVHDPDKLVSVSFQILNLSGSSGYLRNITYGGATAVAPSSGDGVMAVFATVMYRGRTAPCFYRSGNIIFPSGGGGGLTPVPTVGYTAPVLPDVSGQLCWSLYGLAPCPGSVPTYSCTQGRSSLEC